MNIYNISRYQGNIAIEHFLYENSPSLIFCRLRIKGEIYGGSTQVGSVKARSLFFLVKGLIVWYRAFPLLPFS